MKFLLLLLLIATNSFAAPLFETSDCHPIIKTPCPLDPYYQNANLFNRLRNKFIITYKGLVEYYDHVSEGMIYPNPETFELQDSQYRPLSNQDREYLRFMVDYDKMVLSPIQDLSPETAEKLFRFSNEKFNQKMGTGDFLKSQIKYYNLTRFDQTHLRFDREIILFSDWKSLIHPPIFKINEISITNRSPESIFRTVTYHEEQDALTDAELTKGNELKLLVNNTSYAEKIRLVQNAQKFVFLAVMSFAPTKDSERLINALIAKAQAGVDVRVILEGVWTMVSFKKTLWALRKGGVKVELADDLLRFGRNQGLFHSKFIIVDGEIGTVGGQNLVDRSHKGTGYNHFNKDTDVRVKGPAITDLMSEYIALWERFSKSDFPVAYKELVNKQKEEQRRLGLRGSENYPAWFGDKREQGLCRFVSQGPYTDKYKISKAYVATFDKATKNILYTSQHISFNLKKPEKWSSKIYESLMAKAESEVPVTLISNGIDGGFLKSVSPGNPFADFFTRKINDLSGYLNTVIRRAKLEEVARVENFQVWQHFQYIHSKVAIIDSEVAAIGSYNFEDYSAEHSYETAIFCEDDGLINELFNDLRITMANSTPLVLNSDAHK